MSDEVLVKVEGVSKKFCRSLKRSLWYGVQDVSAEIFGRKGSHNQLRKNEFWAVNDVSFELKRGECLGLIGPNGAGKSTLLKMLNGLVKPDQGRITMRGRVGALIELGAGFNPILTARENIYVNGAVLGFTKKEIDRKFDAIVDFAEIEEFIDTPVQSFSSGMKVRLGFAVAAQMEPNVLMIDEVLAVGDFHFRQKCLAKINDMKSEKSIIFVSHSMDTIRMFCERAIVLERGRVVCDGDVSAGISVYVSRSVTPGVESRGKEENATKQEYGSLYLNSKKIDYVEHGWSKRTYDHGEPMEFQFDLRLKSFSRNLIIGIPVWDSRGNRVTAFNSDQAGYRFNSKTMSAKGVLKTTCYFNPGDYESCTVIQDGPEVLYRQPNALVTVRDRERLYGFATFPQRWESRSDFVE